MSRLARVSLGAGLLLAGCRHAAPPATEPSPMGPPMAVQVNKEPAAPDTTPAFPTTRPTLAPAPAVQLPPITTRTLANGLTLMVVEQHELPVVDLALVVGTGSEADPAGRAGLATLVGNLLQEGTATRTSLQVADQEAYLGVSLGSGAGWDLSRVTLHAPTAQLDSAMALFADVALRPAFPAPELERLRKDRLTALIQARDRGPDVASRAYASVLYGDRHPYGQVTVGTEASTKAITRADVQKFYATYYRPNNATLLVVGDVTPDDAVRRATALFGGWKRAAVPAVAYPTAPKSGATTVYLIDKPGAAQSSVRIGGVGVARSTRDYFALQVLNTVLGGPFTSRLNNNLREVHAYTYGAGSRFDMRRQAGPFSASGEIVTAKTDSALVEFMKELARIRDTVPADELQKAKQYLQLQLPGDFETTGDIAAQLVPVIIYGLPLDYYNGYVRNVAAVTQADVQRVARQYLDPSKMAVVVVGDRKTIEPGIRALNLGTVVLRDATGKTIAP